MAIKNIEDRQAWISKAKALLDDAQIKLVERFQVGCWVIHEGGEIEADAVFKTKADALAHAKNTFLNARKNFVVEKISPGAYCYSYRSPDDGEEYHFYVEHISSSNILTIVENVITTMLPDEYFSPYSKLYNVLH